MPRRVLHIFTAHLREAARSPLAWLGLLALLVATSAISQGFGGEEAASRAWLARSLTTEGLRLLLPLAAIMGAAYIIRPSIKRGWSILPVRRGEWFLGSALACFAFVALGALVIAASGALACGVIGDAAKVEQLRYADDMRYVGPRALEGERPFLLAGPEHLEFKFDSEGVGETVSGKLDFEIAWTMAQAPGQGVPLEITLKGEREVKAQSRAQARRKATFSAPHPGGKTITVFARAIDPALSVGLKRDGCRLVLGRESAAPSLFWISLTAMCAALLCAGLTLCVRALSTAPTAALAGALLLASLTLLPALAPGDAAAQARRRDVEGESRDERSATQALAETLSALPPLNEPRNFERVLAGEAADDKDMLSALARLGAAMALLAMGAALFGRREIS